MTPYVTPEMEILRLGEGNAIVTSNETDLQPLAGSEDPQADMNGWDYDPVCIRNLGYLR